MSIVIARGSMPFNGISIYDNDSDQTIATVNGAGDLSSISRTPILLLSLDPHTIYGLSHPAIISEILQYGPRVLISTKSLAHNMFEHGMKASHGKVSIGQNTFMATLETYYRVESNMHGFSVVEGQRGFAISYKKSGLPTILLHSSGFQALEVFDHRAINVDAITDYLKIE